MNDEKMIQVLAKIYNEAGNGDIGFDMDSWYEESSRTRCGSTACLAGWAAMAAGYDLLSGGECIKIGSKRGTEVISYVADDWLELDGRGGGMFFFLGNLHEVYSAVADEMKIPVEELRERVRAMANSASQ